MHSNISKVALILAVFLLIFLIFTPYFTSDFMDLRQQKENEENYLRQLQEQARAYLTGKFDPAEKEDFVLVPSEYTVVPNKMYLRRETYYAYFQMQNAAKKNEVDLKVASATRNFDYQKDIWDKKWTGYTLVQGQDLSKSIPDGRERFKKILEYSAVPGISRHHWGTDIDINNANPEYFDTEGGKKAYQWLAENAYLFGFCQTYNLKGQVRPTGHNEEKWHWSYLPLAKTFTEEYKNLVTEDDIKGFEGDEYVDSLNLINDYVLGINPVCL